MSNDTHPTPATGPAPDQDAAPTIPAPAVTPPPASAAASRLVADLSALAHQRRLIGLRRHRYGDVTTAMIAATGAATTEQEADAFTTVAVAFATYHRAASAPRRGRLGTSIGRAMRQIGGPGGYGPRDPGAVRALDRLHMAAVYEDLHTAVVAVAATLDSDASPPHWAALADDLVAWQNPGSRDRIRTKWARDFNTRTIRPAADAADAADAPDAVVEAVDDPAADAAVEQPSIEPADV